MSTHRGLRVLDAAREMAAEVIAALDENPRRIVARGQIIDCATGVPANISEAFGRLTDADRNRVLGIARGEAEEAISRLKTNFDVKRLDPKVYWRLHNRLTTIVKMLNSLMS